MNSFQTVSGVRHVYRVKGWLLGLYLLLGGAGVIGGIYCASTAISASNPDGWFPTLVCAAFGTFLLALAIRPRIVIEGNRIEVRVLRERSAELSEIEGSRTTRSQNTTNTVLYLKDGRGKIAFPQIFATDDDYRAWFQQVTDLDARDRDDLLAEISNQADLGATPEDRLGALSQAKTWNIVFCVVLGVAAVALNWGPSQFWLYSAALLALTPVAAFFLLKEAPLLCALFKKKADPRPDLGTALAISAFGLLFKANDFKFVSMQPLFFPIGLLILAYFLAFFSSARKSSSPKGAIYGVLVFAAMYSYGLTIASNTVNDTSKPTTYLATVTGKYATTGKNASNNLWLTPWGPMQERNEISVSAEIYRNTQKGDLVCLDLYPGRLHVPWYQLVSCPTQPN